MSAAIFETSFVTDLDDATYLSGCGKEMRAFLDRKPYLICGRFFCYDTAKVSDVRSDLNSSNHKDKDYLLSQIEELTDEDEITVG